MSVSPLLSVRDLKVHFPVKHDLFAEKRVVKAVDGVSFDLHAGETLGIVGESGCGKSTLGRAVLKLIPSSAGKVVWLGRPLEDASKTELRGLRRDMQIIFQDPLAALDPRMTVGAIVAEPLDTFEPGMAEKDKRARDIGRQLERVRPAAGICAASRADVYAAGVQESAVGQLTIKSGS